MIRSITSTVLALALTATASASPLMEYNDIDIGYRHTFFDDSVLDDGNGLDLNARFAPFDPIFFEVGYEYIKTGVESFDLDGHLLSYGGGAYFGCADGIQLLGRFGGLASWIDPEQGETQEETGWYAGTELRALVHESVELDLSVNYNDIGDAEAWIYGASAVIALTDTLGWVTSVDINDENDVSLFGGVRIALS